MATTTLFEHEAKAFDWSFGDLAALERMRRAVGAEVLRGTTRGVERVLQATQYVGVVRLGHHTIQILPKLHRSDDPNPSPTRSSSRG